MLEVSGFVVGLIVGLTGVGGGALMTPLLIWFFHYEPVQSVGTDLWFALIIKLIASIFHFRSDSIDWKVARGLWIGSVPVTLIVLIFLYYSPATDLKKPLTLLISAVVLLTSMTLIFPFHQIFSRFKNRPDTKTQTGVHFTGAVIGFLVSLTSIGAGALGSLALMSLYPQRMSYFPRLVATDIVHSIPIALIGGVAYFLMGQVNLALLGTLLLGAVPGVVLGTLLVFKVPRSILKILLGLLLLIAGLKGLMNSL